MGQLSVVSEPIAHSVDEIHAMLDTYSKVRKKMDQKGRAYQRETLWKIAIEEFNSRKSLPKNLWHNFDNHMFAWRAHQRGEVWRPMMATVLSYVARSYGVKVSDIKSESHTRKIASARFEAAYLMAICTRRSTVEIGIYLGNRDHTTILHAIARYSYLRNKPMPDYLHMKSVYVSETTADSYHFIEEVGALERAFTREVV